MHEAKYGQLAGSDPIKALQRDSSFADEGDEVDESAIGHMYETQLMQLERLITVQRRCHNRSKQVNFEFKGHEEWERHPINALICIYSFNIVFFFMLTNLFFDHTHPACRSTKKNFRTR